MSVSTMGNASGSKRDWAMFACGILVSLAGVFVMFAPGMSLVTLAIVAGVFFLVAGVGCFTAYGRMKGAVDGAGWMLANGICDVLLGAMFVIWPVATASILPWIVGIWVLVYSVYAIIAGIAMKRYLPVWGLVLSTGIIGAVCGIMFITYPPAFPIFLAVFLMMRGITMSVDGIVSPGKLDYL